MLRKSNNRILDGVCGGLAEYFNTDVTLIRLIFVIVSLFTGVVMGLIAYVIMIFVMPPANDDDVLR